MGWLALFLLTSVLGGTVGSVLFAERCEAQEILVDSTTEQYRRHPKVLNALASGPFTRWGQYLKLSGWRILVRADTVGRSSTAQAEFAEPYRNAIITVDLEKLDPDHVDEMVLHELLHVKLSNLTYFVRTSIIGHDESLLGSLFTRYEEGLVVDLSRAILGATW